MARTATPGDEPARQPKLAFKPVTEATREDFRAVFAKPGGPKYCWCMLWRASPQELKDAKGQAREKQILGRIDQGVPVGLVGYADGEPVAWVSVAPKATFRGLGGPEPEEGEKVFSLTCMHLPRVLRAKGMARQLIAAAVAHARKHKADVLEAYPVDPDSPSYRHMGLVPAFEAQGFTEVGREGTRRHVMRLTLRKSLKS
jgi:GNAT superfamily N-acetyltransferase